MELIIGGIAIVILLILLILFFSWLDFVKHTRSIATYLHQISINIENLVDKEIQNKEA